MEMNSPPYLSSPSTPRTKSISTMDSSSHSSPSLYSTSASSSLPSTSMASNTPTSGSTSPASDGFPSDPNPYKHHRMKRPIKSILKRSIYGSSSPSPQPSPLSTPTTPKARSYTCTTPSATSSSFSRRHPNKQRHNNEQQNDNGEDDEDDDCSWRNDGKELRNKLLEQDDATGGSEFVINRQCKLRNYYSIADRVQDQFQATYAAGDKLEEAYIMGNRLIKFLAEVLPTHHHFYSKNSEYTKLRIKNQNNLLKVRNQMDDVAYFFDKEVYKTVMKAQGLEYDLSPGRGKNGKIRRKKKVMFALEFTNDDERGNANNQRVNNGPIILTPKPPSKCGPKQRTDSTLSSTSQSLSADFDLSLWEKRDPGMEIIDMSLTSDEHDNSIDFNDLSSSFDISSSSLEGATPSSFHDQIEDQKLRKDEVGGRPQSQSGGFSGNIFDSMNDDDGWESVQGSSVSNLAWPEDVDQFQNGSYQLGAEKLQHADEEGFVHELDQRLQSRRAPDEHGHGGDEDTERSSDFESEDDDIYQGLDMSMDDNVPFVEKIALENIYRGINELQGDEDSDAADSWEQDDNDDVKNLDSDEFRMNLDNSLGSTMSLSMEDSTGSNVQYDEEHVMNVSDPEEHLITLQQEFLTSFDEYDVEDDDSDDSDESSSDSSSDSEHSQFVQEMTEMEFPDEVRTCDSSGADKTVVTTATAETEPTTTDDYSEGSKNSSNDHNEPIIGISRRDSYYPSFDSPQRNNNIVLPIKLEYLEHKVKDLQVKQVNRDKAEKFESDSISENSITVNSDGSTISSASSQLDQTTQKSSYPVQMARSSEALTPRSPDIENSQKTKTQLQSGTTPEKTSEATGSPNESSKPHPTAARLRNLRKTAAWKRRFGKQ